MYFILNDVEHLLVPIGLFILNILLVTVVTIKNCQDTTIFHKRVYLNYPNFGNFEIRHKMQTPYTDSWSFPPVGTVEWWGVNFASRIVIRRLKMSRRLMGDYRFLLHLYRSQIDLD